MKLVFCLENDLMFFVRENESKNVPFLLYFLLKFANW